MTTKNVVPVFFHTFVNGKWQYQGHVIRMVSPGALRVQLYSAVDGWPGDERIIALSSCEWRFFDTAEEWRNAGQQMHNEFFRNARAARCTENPPETGVYR